MKLIIAGSRNLDVTAQGMYGLLVYAFDLAPKEIICGGASGIDQDGRNFAIINNIPVKMFLADWQQHGKSAGPIRNKQMAEYADALLLIWDGESRGSKNMKQEMLKLNKPVYEVILKTHNEATQLYYCQW